MSEGLALSACVRAATRRTQMIKQHASRAAHGPKANAKHQLDQAIIQTRHLLDELQEQQLILGWKNEDAA